MEKPVSPALTATQIYEITITTYCGTAAHAGLVFNNPGTFIANVEFWFPAKVTMVDTGTFQFAVGAQDFSSAEIIWFWSNTNLLTNLVVKFQPSSTIPKGGTILVGFPTYDYTGTIKIFDSNLGIPGIT